MCRSFETDPANALCAQCVYTVAGDPRLGPLVSFTSGSEWTNVGGCIALIDGDTSSTGCGAKNLALSKCLDAACDGCNDQAWYDCLSVARQTVCASYEDAAICWRRPAYAVCIESTFEEQYLKLAAIFCATGSDAGVTNDASADDAARLDSGRDAGDSGGAPGDVSSFGDVRPGDEPDSLVESGPESSPLPDAQTLDADDAQRDDAMDLDASSSLDTAD